jgi:hypothetical protein
MIFNITKDTFGGKMKMGDIIASLNILEFLKEERSENIKYYLPDEVIQDKDHVRKFRDFLIIHSNYISEFPGDTIFPYGPYEIWSFREFNGEKVFIKPSLPIENYICIFPLIDATYNTERNWSHKLLQSVIDEYDVYENYHKVICIHGDIPENINTRNFIISKDFNDNINYAIRCKYYIGGDTGFSHFVSTLKSEEKYCKYLYSKGQHGGWRSEFTCPFYINENNNKLEFYE